MRKITCKSCIHEMEGCYIWQNKEGFSSGLDWISGCCFYFVIENKTGKVIVY